MKTNTKTYYVCDCCGKEYENIKLAEQCEARCREKEKEEKAKKQLLLDKQADFKELTTLAHHFQEKVRAYSKKYKEIPTIEVTVKNFSNPINHTFTVEADNKNNTTFEKEENINALKQKILKEFFY